MSFRDDKDALAAQVDALTREADELREERDKAVAEAARLAAANESLLRGEKPPEVPVERPVPRAPPPAQVWSQEPPSATRWTRGRIFLVVAALILPLVFGFLAVECAMKQPGQQSERRGR
jgi:hypothetical protein